MVSCGRRLETLAKALAMLKIETEMVTLQNSKTTMPSYARLGNVNVRGSEKKPKGQRGIRIEETIYTRRPNLRK